jgi:5'-nucleotidase
MRVLVANDDGLDAPGLHALAQATAAAGHEVTVVAPDRDQSGLGAALTLDVGHPIALRRRELPELPDVAAAGIDGSPALAVLLAGVGAFGPRPQVVLAGVNAGANVGRAILHSGTVGAVLTAASMNLSALAVSLDGEQPRHWAVAAHVAALTLDWLLAAPRRTLLNVNVPDVPLERLRGARWGRLAAYGSHRLVVHDRATRLELELQEHGLPVDPQTDAGLLAAGYASITPLQAVQALPDTAAAVAVDAALGAAPDPAA